MKKFLIIILTIIILFAVGIGAAFVFEEEKLKDWFGEKASAPADDEAQKKVLKPIPQPDQVTLNLMFFGDIYFGRYIDDEAQTTELKYAYPFSKLETFNRENYDAWIGNLECPVTTTYRSSAAQNKNLMFSCRPEYIPEARKWFDIFSLANNHTDNMEHVDGFQQTKDFLDQSDFQYFGHYDNGNSQEVCEVVTIKGSPSFLTSLDSSSAMMETELLEHDGSPPSLGGAGGGYEDEYQSLLQRSDEKIAEDYEGTLHREYKIPIALCGFHGVFNLPTDSDIAVIEEYAKYLPTFIMPHQGVEYVFKANRYQENIYRKMIDLGADGVIGGHTHTVQNTEVYKDKLIVYSLGNFIFDQTSVHKTQGMALESKFIFANDENFQKWMTISEQCQINEDSCLSQAKDLSLTKPVFTIEYDAIGTDNTGRIAKKASPKVEQIILDRANWEETQKALSEAGNML